MFPDTLSSVILMENQMVSCRFLLKCISLGGYRGVCE